MFIVAKCIQTTILVIIIIIIFTIIRGAGGSIIMLIHRLTLQKVQKFSSTHALILELIVDHRIFKLVFIDYYCPFYTFCLFLWYKLP